MANEAIKTTAAIKPGRKVIINIGLMGGQAFRNTLLPQQRVVIMGAMLRELMVPGYRAEIQAHAGQEPTLVVTGVFNLSAPCSLLAWDACVLAEQDCIAVYYPGGLNDMSDGQGVLFGPNAESWGDFDSNYFLLPMVVYQ